MSDKPPERMPLPGWQSQQPGESDERLFARRAADPAVQAAFTSLMLSRGEFQGLRLAELTEEIEAHAVALRDSGLERAESTLQSQATTLDQMFNKLTRTAWAIAEKGLGRRELDMTERLMRLALTAQRQSRATLETLAFVRNPQAPIFARQANVTTGPQQVNNGVVPGGAEPARARPAERSAPSKLLEQTNGERLDTGTAGTAVGGNPPLEAVGALDGTEERRGQSARGAKRLERRAARRDSKAR